MTDVIINFDDLQGALIPIKAVDNGDDTYSFAAIPVINSVNVVTSQMSNTNIATLITNVNSYLAGSSLKFHSISFSTTVVVAAVTFYVIITEIS